MFDRRRLVRDALLTLSRQPGVPLLLLLPTVPTVTAILAL